MKFTDYCCLGNGVRCGMSYRKCLQHKGIDLKENGRDMSKLIKRNLSPLFSKDSPTRIAVYRQGWQQGIFHDAA